MTTELEQTPPATAPAPTEETPEQIMAQFIEKFETPAGGPPPGIEPTEGDATVVDPAAAAQPPAQDAILAAVDQKLEAFADKLMSVLQPPAPKPGEPLLQPTKNGEADVIPFVKDMEDFKASVESPEKFNTLLTRVYNQAIGSVLHRVPEVVVALVQHHMTVSEITRDFYTRNPDLVPHADYLAHLTNQIQNQNPKATFKQVTEKVEEEARKRFPKSTGGNGGMVGGGARAPRAPINTKALSPIGEMLQFGLKNQKGR